MITRCARAFVFGAIGLVAAAAWAQTDTASDEFSPPRTPWGAPDLQGVWDYRTITPMERPRQFGDREFYTDEEIAELEGRAAERMDQPPGENAPVNLVHAQYMTDPGRYVDESRRTSLVIDPKDGRVPAMKPDARERMMAARASSTVDLEQPWKDRTLLERCITRGLPGAILPGLYNNNIQIVQAPDRVAIIHEMVHETRIVPLDDSDFTGVRSFMGESRGHWEGDTLVVETTNFNDQVSYRGASENLRLTERYTLIAPDRIDFRMTIEDDTVWERPWTVAYLMRPTDGQIYEYACHEGNYGLRNILENIIAESAEGESKSASIVGDEE
ncbi:MAG: hypothetical protein ACWGPN_09640 [Gammaproteobacteria bacterium]